MVTETGTFSDISEIEFGPPSPRFPTCLTRQLTTYALGRGPLPADRDPLVDIEAAFAESGYRFEELIVAIATSELFGSRRGGQEAP